MKVVRQSVKQGGVSVSGNEWAASCVGFEESRAMVSRVRAWRHRLCAMEGRGWSARV